MWEPISSSSFLIPILWTRKPKHRKATGIQTQEICLQSHNPNHLFILQSHTSHFHVHLYQHHTSQISYDPSLFCPMNIFRLLKERTVRDCAIWLNMHYGYNIDTCLNFLKKKLKPWDTCMAQSFELLTLDLGPGHDLMVVRSSTT